MLWQKTIGDAPFTNPYVFGSAQNGSNGATSLSLTLPAKIPAGSTIYICLTATHIITTNITVSMTTSGYTEIYNTTINTSGLRRAALWTKVSDGTETSVSVSISNTSVIRLGCIVISNGSGYGANALFNNSVTSTPDPAALTFNTTNAISLVIYHGVAGGVGPVTVSTLPTGYNLAFEGFSINLANSKTVGMFCFYRKLINSGSQNPSSFTTSRAMSVHTYTVSHEN